MQAFKNKLVRKNANAYDKSLYAYFGGNRR